jgi:hypothetical protein
LLSCSSLELQTIAITGVVMASVSSERVAPLHIECLPSEALDEALPPAVQGFETADRIVIVFLDPAEFIGNEPDAAIFQPNHLAGVAFGVIEPRGDANESRFV